MVSLAGYFENLCEESHCLETSVRVLRTCTNNFLLVLTNLFKDVETRWFVVTMLDQVMC